jgi:hypothetical protein
VKKSGSHAAVGEANKVASLLNFKFCFASHVVRGHLANTIQFSEIFCG